MGPSEARKAALFPTLDADQIGILAELGVEIVLATGDAVFMAGEPVESFFVVIEGELLVTKRAAEGQSTMAVHKPGEFTGGLSPMSGHATRPSRVLRIERAVFNRLLTDCSPVAHILLPAMASRLRDIETVAQQSNRLAALGKLAAGLAHELNNPATAANRGQPRRRQAPPHDRGRAGAVDVAPRSRNIGGGSAAALRSAGDRTAGILRPAGSGG